MFKTYLKAIFLSIFCALNASAAHSVSLLRDPDIEYGLQQLAEPILRAANLNSDDVKVWIVNDMGLNAFIIDHTHIFLHAGLVLQLKSAAQLQSVIAHEAAHISNGHISRRLANAKRAKLATSFGVLVAAAAVAAGHTDAGLGLALGATGSVNRVLLAHTRIEESAADQSALRFMNAAKVDPAAMVEVFKLFIGQSNLSEEHQDPYTRSHPLNRDRIRTINAYAATAPSHRPDVKQAYWFSRIQGKLSGFLRAPQWTLRRATGSSDVDLMRRAIAEHRSGRSSTAQKEHGPAGRGPSQRCILPGVAGTNSIGKPRIFGCNKSLCQRGPAGAQQCAYLGGLWPIAPGTKHQKFKRASSENFAKGPQPRQSRCANFTRYRHSLCPQWPARTGCSGHCRALCIARQYAKCRHTGQTGRRPPAARLGGMAKGAGYFGRGENALVG